MPGSKEKHTPSGYCKMRSMLQLCKPSRCWVLGVESCTRILDVLASRDPKLVKNTCSCWNQGILFTPTPASCEPKVPHSFYTQVLTSEEQTAVSVWACRQRRKPRGASSGYSWWPHLQSRLFSRRAQCAPACPLWARQWRSVSLPGLSDLTIACLVVDLQGVTRTDCNVQAKASSL